MKFKVSKPKLPKPEQGFTMVEVLIAILIATIFVAVTMQMMALAAMFKVRAQEYAEATAWIQEDLESVKYEAANLQYTSSLSANAAANASSITIASASRFRANDSLKVGSDPGTYTISSISGTTLNITPNLGTDQTSGAEVSATNTRCKSSVLTTNATSGASAINVASVRNFAKNDSVKIGSGTYTISSINGTQSQLNITPNLTSAQQGGSQVVIASSNAGFADGLQDWISDTNHSDGITDITSNSNKFINPPNTGNLQTSGNALTSKLFENKTFSLTRTTTIPSNSSDAPYRVLQISYSVAAVNAHTTLSTAAAATSTTLSVVSASGFKSGDKLTVGTDNDNEIQSISGNTITLKAALGSDQPSGSIVDASVATTSTEVIPNAALQCPN